MARFFLKPTWPLIFTSAFIVFVTVFVCLYALLYVDDILKERSYSIEAKKYQEWITSAEGNKCQEILKSCDDETYRLFPNIDGKSYADQLRDHLKREKHKKIAS